MLRFVKTLGIRNEGQATIRWSSEVKPALGGLTFYIIFLLSIILHSFIFSYEGSNIDFKFTGIVGATSLGFLMGLSDDAYNTRPVLKFITQVLCGVILIYSGTYINIFESDLKVMKGCSHNAHLEEPDKFNKIVNEFLKKN